jgi:hypothetical protein
VRQPPRKNHASLPGRLRSPGAIERRATDAEPLATIFVAPNRSAPGGDPFVTDIACTTPARSDICPFVAIWASLIRKEPRAGLLAPALIPA